MENWERDLGRFWPDTLELGTVGSPATAEQVVAHVNRVGNGIRRIGVESAFLPAGAEQVLRRDLSNIEIVDAVVPLERLRARKTPQEIEYLREASERVVESMSTTFKACKPGLSKHDVAERLRREEVNRGLVFDYCLIAAGDSFNRAPSEQRLAAGDIISLDSGGNYKGYIGDLCRMGIVGEPDSELIGLLDFVDDVQLAARKPIRAGARGGDIIAIGQKLVEASPHRSYTHFMAHGMGLVSHEAPRLMTLPRLSYTGDDAERPLESGMVISIETTMNHPKRGLVKLEDTLLVTERGCEGLGDAGIEARHDGAEQEASLVIGENVAAQAKAGIVVIAPHVGVPEIDESAWDRLACAGQNEAGKLDRLPRNARLAEITALRRSGFEEGSLG